MKKQVPVLLWMTVYALIVTLAIAYGVSQRAPQITHGFIDMKDIK